MYTLNENGDRVYTLKVQIIIVFGPTNGKYI